MKAKDETSNRFHIPSSQCSQSLKTIVKFYRIFGFSFSGVLFTNDGDTKVHHIQHKEYSPNQKPNNGKWMDMKNDEDNKNNGQNKLRRMSYLLIGYNVMTILAYLTPFVMNTTVFQRMHYGTNSTTHQIDFSQYFANNGNEKYDLISADYAQLKPLLRQMIKSLVALFMLDGLLSFVHNLCFGGKLIRQIAQISDCGKFSGNKNTKCSWRIISAILFTCPLIMCSGVMLFHPNRFVEIWQSFVVLFMRRDSNNGEHQDEEIGLMLKQIAKVALHFAHYIYLTCNSALFVFAMHQFEQKILHLNGRIGKDTRLREADLFQLKSQLLSLKCQYRETLSYFSVPITVTLGASTFTIIGSVCFIMISPAKSYASFIFSIGLFALIRLVLVASAGNGPTNAYRTLLRSTFEAIHDPDWTVDGWLCFIELRRMREQFKATFFGETFTVRQSAILSMVGFALNYIVVLLQTESYGSSRG